MTCDARRERVAILTGAAGGIGQATALTLAREGWTLILTDREEPSLSDLRSAASEAGADVSFVAADVTQEQDVARVVRHAVERHGRLDGFVCNAGIPGVVRPLVDYPPDVFGRVMDVNVGGTFHCLRHALPALLASGGGSFVAMGSTSSIRGRANLAAYVASKHAVLGLVRTAALEHVGSGVRVNAVLPGPTRTAMIDTINDMAAELPPESAAVRRAVAAAYGSPQDVANTVAFLLSPLASHMNGSALVIDGGSTLA
jgi:NAD(P)-dependent dehydrogenase (short-subunit alcohol dehydrogenase family)